jgi:ubiquinone/menaquinone biosynthesis C-methylase UbiE
MASTVPSYEKRFMPWLFNLAVALIFAPFGGARKLRNRALDLTGIGPGSRVLELGCGTGGVTALILARGANVLALDGSARMLEQARRAAPAADFKHAQLEDLDVSGSYNVVLLAFVLHELSPALRRAVLAKGLAALDTGGRIAILDHAVPSSRLGARFWRRLLMMMEPPSVRDCIEKGYAAEIQASGGETEAVHLLAGGTAALTLAKPL